MICRPRLVTSTALLTALALLHPSPAAAAGPGPVDLVRPFVGTQNFGNTFPGASAPFGMVQVSPDTGGQGGYDYKQSAIYGFSQTHLSGVGCGVAGELPMLPTTGAVGSVDADGYKSAFSHDDEEASPGYYRVALSRYDVSAPARTTTRSISRRASTVRSPPSVRGAAPRRRRAAGTRAAPAATAPGSRSTPAPTTTSW